MIESPKVGDLVRLMSGGPVMTVTNVEKNEFEPERTKLRCAWFERSHAAGVNSASSVPASWNESWGDDCQERMVSVVRVKGDIPDGQFKEFRERYMAEGGVSRPVVVDSDVKLVGFVETPVGIFHAENHRKLVEALPKDSGMRKLLEVEGRRTSIPEISEMLAMLDLAWGLIANAGNGDWSKETEDWVRAAERWRNRYTTPTMHEPPERVASDRITRQHQVFDWARLCFGDAEATSVPQRGLRLLEEAVELFQACGNKPEMAHKLVDYVFDREPGGLAQEVGGVSVTLLALCAAAKLFAENEERREIARILDKSVKHFTDRNAAKNAAGFKAP